MLPPPNIDFLTHLPNAIYARQTLQILIYSAANSTEFSVGVVFLDVFGLNAHHNFYGHQPIDDVLCAVARTMSAFARESEIVCRYGGDMAATSFC